MINQYEKEIINKLIDKFENSKSFIGENKVNQKFSVKTESLFPQYSNHSNFNVFSEVNDAVDILIRKNIVTSEQNAAHLYNNIALNLNNIELAYNYIGRYPKKDLNEKLIALLNKYSTKNQILSGYCISQIDRINSNKTVEHFTGNFIELENVLIACFELFNVNKETFKRDFSIRIFKDSKMFENIENKVINILYQYGDFSEREAVLGELNIVKNPTYINFKGAGTLTLGNQEIDLRKINGDIAISSLAINDIDKINATGSSVITIENLTSFHAFNDKNKLVIYLGGYHNKIRRDFIKLLYYQNPNVNYYHFGDIDAGGFHILEHLKRETGVNFIPYKMDIETLKDHIKYAKKLTENDRIRLVKLLNTQYNEVVNYMLENNCKLEQESIHNFDIID
jgi:hypothetical protein